MPAPDLDRFRARVWLNKTCSAVFGEIAVVLLRLLAALAAAVLLAGCLGGSMGGGLGKIGQPVRDGSFEFVVTSVDNEGGAVRVHLKVTNTGDGAKSFDVDDQRLLSGGKTYDPDLRASGDTRVDLKPGMGAEAVVAFQVPPGTVPEAIELRDSLFSRDVKVALS